MSAILDFYARTGRDHRGRSLEEILSWNDDILESRHDYIQWLFPLDVPSGFSSAAPILTSEDRQAFRTDQRLRETLERVLLRMLRFYGLECGDTPAERKEIRPSPRFPEHAKTWLYPGSHNYLRLSRILRSLGLLGMRSHADRLLACLRGIYREHAALIGDETYSYWSRATLGTEPDS